MINKNSIKCWKTEKSHAENKRNKVLIIINIINLYTNL